MMQCEGLLTDTAEDEVMSKRRSFPFPIAHVLEKHRR